MNLNCKPLTHSLYGDVRIALLDNLFLVYCATDVARMLGFRDPYSAVKNHCKAQRRLRYEDRHGARVMNFITAADIERLCDAALYRDAAEIHDWLVYAVPAAENAVPAAERRQAEKEQMPDTDTPRNTVVRRSDMIEIYDALTLIEGMLKIISEYVNNLIAEE